MKRWHLIIDIEKCENCNNCFLACKDEHVDNEWPGYAAPQKGEGKGWIEVLGKERGVYPFIDVAYLPLTCMHCDDAPCIKASKNGEVYKRPDGIVIIDPRKAKGKKEIVSSCPYGVIVWNEGLNLPQKCTLCAHLLDENWGKTRCVQSCPTGALRLAALSEDELEGLKTLEGLEVYRPHLNTKPMVLYKNLYRFTHCFIGGSVATIIDGKEECLEGARVTLTKDGDKIIGETKTDCFGDFKFDRLEEDSGLYTVKIESPGKEGKTLQVDLKKSTYIGVIYL
ncbi:MAG: hypothetical protein N2745_08045 [Syntrophorhabdaceae bacterium]|nr:hypothetical protein [Syntrophorhabdaceae bacterium]